MHVVSVPSLHQFRTTILFLRGSCFWLDVSLNFLEEEMCRTTRMSAGTNMNENAMDRM